MGLLLIGLLGLLIAAPRREKNETYRDETPPKDWIEEKKRNDPGGWVLLKNDSENRRH